VDRWLPGVGILDIGHASGPNADALAHHARMTSSPASHLLTCEPPATPTPRRVA
jgi:hypothetical protein